MENVSEERKEKQRDRVENEDSSQGHAHLFFTGFCDRSDGRDCAASANGRAGADQKRGFLLNTNEITESEPHQHRHRDANGRIQKARTPGAKDFVKVHAEAEGNHGSLQQKSCQALAFGAKWVRHSESVDQAAQQRDGWRNQTAGRQDECHEVDVLAHEQSLPRT